MIPIVLFLLSIGLQLAAAVYALLLIRITGRRSAWILISIAMVLMTSRRIVSFVSILTSGKKFTYDIPEIIALTIAFLMLIGVLRIRHYFQSINLARIERKRAEEEVQQSEARLKEAQRIASIGNWELDLISNKLIWSDEIYSIFEIDPKAFGASYEAFLQTVHPEDRAMVDRAYTGSVKNRTPYDIVHRLLMADGRVKYVHERCETFYDSEGKPVRSAGTVQDITKRKQAEEDSQKAQKFIENILETVDEGFIVMDRGFKIISANKAYLKFLDMPFEKVIGRRCYELSHRIEMPCYKTGEDCAVKHVFENGKPHACMHIHTDGKGNLIYVENKAYPVKDESGQVVSAIEIINDITEKRKLEEQLRHSQKMEAIGQIAGGIAHDFNNILTAIIGYGHMLDIRMKEDDPLKLYLEPILSSADRAANLTQSLLTFSRKQIINLAVVDMNAIIQKISKFLLRVIGEDVELKTTIAEKELTVMADSGQIEQVLMNLATNARDAMPKGGILTIKTESLKIDKKFIRTYGYGEEGIYTVVSVTDTGIGMGENTRQKIFEPFFTTKEVGKGTGLGLSIVYGIVKQHRGYINCCSELGKGTTFEMYLPLIKKVEEHKETAIARAEEARSGTETVLVAEDEIDVRKIVKGTLEEFGYKVIEAKDGEEAIQKFKENKDTICLLFFDVVMPKMGGKEAYEKIKKIKPDVKVLFASGYPSDFIHREEILKEGYAFISKPVSPTIILKKVREVLDKEG